MKTEVERECITLIDNLLDKKSILPIDYFLAKRLLQNISCDREDCAVFITYLSKASREGHLCVEVSDDSVRPNPVALLTSDEFPFTPDEESKVEQLIRSAREHFPPSLLADINSHNQFKPLFRRENLYYFQKNWVYEDSFLNHYAKLLKEKPTLSINPEIVRQKLDQLLKSEKVLPKQADAIYKATQNSLTIISGGPGTGKTYTAGILIETLWKSLTEEQKGRIEFAFAAPTGKAASNLFKSVQSAVSSLEGFPSTQAKTLHALLGTRRRDIEIKLKADFILIDESSMIDAQIMSSLLASIKPGARIVFLGDPFQLPPVEAGSLFADMISFFKENITELKKCLRSDLKGIIDFAAAVNKGDGIEAINHLHSGEGVTLRLWDEPTVWKKRSSLLKVAAPLFTNDHQFRILSPMRKGPLGVEALNQLFYQHFIDQHDPNQTFTAPIMLTKNDYRLDLYNGEVGVLVRPPNEDAYILLPTSAGTRKIPLILISKFEYAYCLSVHKSQGSEFNHVIMLLPEGSHRFGRELLYTGATRARKKLEIWGTEETIKKTVATQVTRISGLTKC